MLIVYTMVDCHGPCLKHCTRIPLWERTSVYLVIVVIAIIVIYLLNNNINHFESYNENFESYKENGYFNDWFNWDENWRLPWKSYKYRKNTIKKWYWY